MSISSTSNPTALLGQVAGKNPLALATPFGAGSFVSTLLQELRQSGASAGAGGTAATAALQVGGHHHGNHAGGISQLMSLLQQNPTSGSAASSAASSASSSLPLQALLQNLKNGASARPGQLLSTAV